jgi:hypothetical protein
MSPQIPAKHRIARSAVSLICALVLVSLCAACGSAAINVAHVGSATGATAAASPGLAGVLKFTSCMRAHGVPMLDPGPDGNINYNAGSTPEAVLQRAHKACDGLLPKGVTLSPQKRAAALGRIVKFVHCMLAHHQPMQVINSSDGFVGYGLPQGSNVNMKSQAYLSAEATCAKQYLKAPGTP